MNLIIQRFIHNKQAVLKKMKNNHFCVNTVHKCILIIKIYNILHKKVVKERHNLISRICEHEALCEFKNTVRLTHFWYVQHILFPFLALSIAWVDFYVESCIYNILFSLANKHNTFLAKSNSKHTNTHASILTHSHTQISHLTHSSINPENPEVICRKSYNLL